MNMNELNPAEQARRDQLRSTKPHVYEKISQFDDKLRRGESIAIIQLQYNYICNLTCEHCSIKRFQVQSGKCSITPADVKHLFDQADDLGLARVTVTGGEPLCFPDLDEVIEAIGPDRFYINCDTNGWLLDAERARHLKQIGVDRIQLSIDSLNPAEHDAFRGREGSHARAMHAIDATLDAGMGIFIQTVVTKERLYSKEFKDFLTYFTGRNIAVFVSYAKPVGSWEGHFDNLITRDDFAFMRELEKEYMVFTHLTPAYGVNMGCIGVKGMFSVTQYGDVLPCPYVHASIGNIMEQPLAEIIQRGLDIKYFGEHVDTCLIAEDKDFIRNHIEKGLYGKPLPVDSREVFGPEDKTKDPFQHCPDLLFPQS